MADTTAPAAPAAPSTNTESSSSSDFEGAPTKSWMDDSVDTSTDAPETPAAKAETKPAPKKAAAEPEKPPAKKWELDGEAYESEEDFMRAAKRWRAESKAGEDLRKYLDEAAQARTELDEFKELSKRDQMALLKKLGVDPDAFAKQQVLRQIQEEEAKKGLSPEQLKARDEHEASRRELEELRAKLKEREDKDQKEAHEKTKQERRQYFVNIINDALKETTLPHTDEVTSMMAEELRRASKYNQKHDPVLIAKRVEERYWSDVDGRIGKLDAKVLLKKYPQLAEQIRRASLEGQGIALPPTVPEAPKRTPPAKRERTYAEQLAYVKEQMRKK